MKKEELCFILGDIEEDYIRQAHIKSPRPLPWFRIACVAACLTAIIAVGLIFAVRGRLDKPALLGWETAAGEASECEATDGTDRRVAVGPESLTVNWVQQITMADMDVAGFADWAGSADTTPEEAFRQALGVSYEEFAARLPEDWSAASLTVLTGPEYDPQTKQKQYTPHDFILRCTTASGGEVRLALCAGEKPLRDVYFVANSPVISEVYGVPVEVYGFEDGFYTYCSYEDIFYDIETKNIPLEDLETLLQNLLQ